VSDDDLSTAILEAALDCVIVIDHAGRVGEFNPAAERTFGYSREEAIGRELAELIIPPDARERHRAALARYLATGESVILGRRIELVGMRAGGQTFPVELTVTRVPGGGSPRFAGYVRDIGERVRSRHDLEAALARERAAREEAEWQRTAARHLVAHTLRVEESERRRLAQALHDGPVQDLLAARFELGRVGRDDPERSSRTEIPLAHALAQLREAIFDLYPPVLERLGLSAAIDELVAELSRRGRARVTAEVAPEATGAQDELLFSLSRELLSNAVRHADAEEVAVRVRREEGELILEVEDDGIGISDEARERALREGHIGLASSAERVEALAGRFWIHRGAEGGTLVRVVLPWRRSSDARPP
jgi:PAS domain S-box-containing protein